MILHGSRGRSKVIAVLHGARQTLEHFDTDDGSDGFRRTDEDVDSPQRGKDGLENVLCWRAKRMLRHCMCSNMSSRDGNPTVDTYSYFVYRVDDDADFVEDCDVVLGRRCWRVNRPRDNGGGI